MAHLGRNLLPTWPILRPSWSHLRPNFAKNLHLIAQRPQRPQHQPGGRQRAPRQPLGPAVPCFRGRFCTSFLNFFCSLSFNSSWPPCLKFKARGGLARAAHWIGFPRVLGHGGPKNQFLKIMIFDDLQIDL